MCCVMGLPGSSSRLQAGCWVLVARRWWVLVLGARAATPHDRVRRSVVSGAVPVWVSPRTLMPDGTVLLHKAQ
jgi:hypothetical protein